MQDFSPLSLERNTCGRTRGTSWVGVPGSRDRAQATPWGEIPLVPGWSKEQGAGSKGGVAEGIAPFYWGIWAGRHCRSWPRTRAPGHASLWLSHPPTPQICPGHRANVPVPVSPLAVLWEGPVVPPGADSIPEALPGIPALSPSPQLCKHSFGPCYWVIYSNSAECFGIRRRAQS